MSLQWDIQVHGRIHSTQDLIKNIDGGHEGLVVHALQQDAGRGRHGRVWEAAEGNLYLSFILKPQCDARLMGQISLLMGVAVHNAAAEFIGEHGQNLMLKWPNDALLCGRKYAGILMESDMSAAGTVEALYVGVGVNLVDAPLDIAVALDGFADAPIDVEVFRDALLGQVKALYTRWLAGNSEAILHEWQEAAHTKNSQMSVKIGDNVQQGKFSAIDEYGSLILSLDENKFKTITAGEVFLPSAN